MPVSLFLLDLIILIIFGFGINNEYTVFIYLNAKEPEM
jgi:hypothetical protein